MSSTKDVHKIKLQQWSQVIHECKSSGMRTKEWLEAHNINRDTYYYWYKQVQKTCVDKIQNKSNTESAPAFIELPLSVDKLESVPVNITKSSNADMAAVLHAGNITIELTNNASSDFVSNLLEVVLRAK